MSCRILSNIICIDDDKEIFGGTTVCISKGGDVYRFGRTYAHEHTSIPIKFYPLKNIKQLACGFLHSVYLDFDGNVFSFGDNSEGQLGNGGKKCYSPQKLEELPLCTQISCGEFFTICVSEDGNLFSFGSNSHGQLGHGDMDKRDSPKKIESLENIDFVECGGYHVFCKLLNDDVYFWGNGNPFLSGDERYQSNPQKEDSWPKNVVDIKCGPCHALILTNEGMVYSYGLNYYGQLGQPQVQELRNPKKIDKLSRIIRIECGHKHSVCIDNENNIYFFGSNSSGQLGLGSINQLSSPMEHPTLRNIIDVSSKGDHTFVKTSDNKIFAFGKNMYAQTGEELSDEIITTPIQVFEDNEDIWYSNFNKSRAKSARK